MFNPESESYSRGLQKISVLKFLKILNLFFNKYSNNLDINMYIDITTWSNHQLEHDWINRITFHCSTTTFGINSQWCSAWRTYERKFKYLPLIFFFSRHCHITPNSGSILRDSIPRSSCFTIVSDIINHKCSLAIFCENEKTEPVLNERGSETYVHWHISAIKYCTPD